jgi:4a-hydroxytetrahydrobiopterin dehydratase
VRDLLTAGELADALESPLAAWQVEDSRLVRSITTATFAEGIRLVQLVAVVADEIDHHPDIDIRWTTVTFRLTTHSAGGLTEMDVRLATEIDRLVADTVEG